MKTYRTLFSGGELFGVGARAAGWRHVDGFEIEPKIAAVARRNGFHVHTADVCQVDYTSLPAVDHLHASPSCKNASQANTEAGETDADLACADAIRRAIAAHTGASFSLENVYAYRNFESFDRILGTLAACGFVVDCRHVNAADYGVPQTRKRLILRAVRGRDRVPLLNPTHRKGGDMFHAPWVGWYAAIEDLLDTLPETKPAPWQLARLPEELRESVLVTSKDTGQEWGQGYRDPRDPAFTCVTDHKESHQPRAFLVGDQAAGAGVGDLCADASAPAMTLRGSAHAPRAFLVGGQYMDSADVAERRAQHVEGDRPGGTITPRSSRDTRALLLPGENGGQEWGKGYYDVDDPAFSVSSSAKGAPRAHVAGRWVRMTTQALGRFQTVPDDYQGLTAEINGNGVPCLLAQRIMESLR